MASASETKGIHHSHVRVKNARRCTYIARVYLDPFDPNAIIKMDVARRLLDRRGYEGILAKTGQKDLSIALRGYLRAPFSNRRTRRHYVADVRAVLGSSVQIRLFKR